MNQSCSDSPFNPSRSSSSPKEAKAPLQELAKEAAKSSSPWAVFAVALNTDILIFIDPVTGKVESRIGYRMLPHIFQGRDNLKGGPRRVKSLGGPVQKPGLLTVPVHQAVPFSLPPVLESKAGLDTMASTFPCIRLHGDHCSPPVSQGIPGRLLETQVQRVVATLSPVLFSPTAHL